MDEHGWLRSVQVVDASPIGDKPESFQLIHEVLESGVGNIVEFGLDQTLNDPKTIPVVCGWYINRASGIMELMRDPQISLKRPPGTTKVWFRGMRVLSQATPSQSAESLVFLMSCVQ